jgi:MFS family permease
MFRRVARAYASAFAGLPREVWLLSVALFINRCGTMVLMFFLLYATQELELTSIVAGQLLSAYGIGAILGSALGGKLSSRYGAIRVQIVCLLLSGGGYVLVGAARTVTALTIDMVLLSLFAEAVRPASVTATTEVSPPELHTRSLALNRLAVNLGMAVGPATGGFLAGIDYSLLFWVNGATCFVSGVFLLAVFGFRGLPAEESEDASPRPRTRSPFRDTGFLAFLALMTLMAVMFFQLLGTFSLYLKSYYGFDELAIGLVTTVNTVIIVILEMVLIHKVEKFDLLRTIGWGTLLIGLGLGMMPFGRGIPFCLASIVVWTVGEMLAFPLAAAWVARRSSARQRGSYMGLYTSTFSIAFVLAPAIGTRLYEIDPDLIWHLCTVSGVLLLAGMYALSRGTRAHSASA